jgi:hypothetical protein
MGLRQWVWRNPDEDEAANRRERLHRMGREIEPAEDQFTVEVVAECQGEAFEGGPLAAVARSRSRCGTFMAGSGSRAFRRRCQGGGRRAVPR